MRIILIQNYGASGTTLLHSLLDDHPQLLTLPALHGANFYPTFKNFLSARDNSRPITLDEVEPFIAKCFQGLTDPDCYENTAWGVNAVGETQAEHACVPADDFLRHVRAELSQSPALASGQLTDRKTIACLRRDILVSVYTAYARCRGQDVSARQAIVCPFHSNKVELAGDILEDFPDARVIHMLRDPVGAMDSSLNHYARIVFQSHALAAVSPIFCGIAQMLNDIAPHIGASDPLRSVYPLHDDLVSRSCAVRLEDLRAEPEQEMRRVAAWCGIDWHEGLLRTTFGGKLWWNRPGTKRVAGCDKTMSHTFKDTTAFDRWRLGCLAKPLSAHFRYARKGRWDAVIDRIGLLACLLPFQYEGNCPNHFRSYILFVRLFLRRWPAAERRWAQPIERWLAARTALLTDITHVLSKEAKAGASDLADEARAETGALKWAAAMFVGGLIGYYRDRRYLYRSFHSIRRQAGWVPLLSDIATAAEGKAAS